jgi:aminoglycoside phosphotransferase (APT) family kinase protein
VAPPRMHADEVHTDVELVRRLLAERFPEWAELPVEPVRFFGTDNAIYRLGEELSVRLPRREHNVQQLEKERNWLPLLAPRLPLAVPLPVAFGKPGAGYPFDWAVYSWLEGEAAYETPPADPILTADDLASLLAAFARIDPAGRLPPGRHNAGRGALLALRDEPCRSAISALAAEIDAPVATAVWEESLAAPEWSQEPVLLHGDLDARNLLVTDGRLSGLVDFGTLGAGDPAADVMVAWKMLTPEARERFRRELDVDDATWTRARGWALSQAVIALAYYTTETNPVLVREARGWLAEVLADSPA